jgi:molecular chaperone HscA
MLFEISEPSQSNIPHKKRYAIGIDLGTTNSLVACMRNGIVDVLPDINNTTMLPSVINIEDKVFSSFKSLMGKVNFIDSGNNNDTNLKISPVELSAKILTILKNRAIETMGENAKLIGAVITVPAYFDEAQRQATKDAAKLADLEVLRLINEPTAAALAYGLTNNIQGKFAVYDLGGGTFDVSILDVQGEVFEVLSTKGDTSLGGDDFDINISKYLNVNINAAKKIKHDISNNIINNITVDMFADINQKLIQKTIDLFAQAIEDAEIEVNDLKGVLLVGGSTRMPCITNILRDFLPDSVAIFNNTNPDEIVAIGAGLQAQAILVNIYNDMEDSHTGDTKQGSGSEFLLLDVVPLSLGVETAGGLVEKIIDRNTTIPITKAQDFTTYKDYQTSMLLHVLQGEREQVVNCRSLGQVVLKNIPPMLAGMPRIRVLFNVNADGLLNVEAIEQTSGSSVSIQIQPSYGLSEDDMLDMLKNGFANAEIDMKNRMLNEEILNSKQLIYSCEQALSRDYSMLNDQQLSVIKKSMEILKNKMQDILSSAEDLKSANKIFSDETQFFADMRMDFAISKALSGKNIDNV